MEDAGGERRNVLMQGERCALKVQALFHAEVEDPELRLTWVNEHDQNHLVISTAPELEHSGRFTAGEQVELTVSFDNVLAPGRYFVSILIARPGGGQDLLDRWERCFSVVVAGPRAAGGLVDLPRELSLERIVHAAPAPLPESTR
jgi:hypothetical protein